MRERRMAGFLSLTQPWQQVLALVFAATVVMGSP
ncbi:MAG: LysE family translocator, partial [Mesorhizobium sp.]